MTLNVTQENGMATTVLDRVLAERAQSDGAKRAHKKRKKEGHDIAANIRDAKQLTTGVLTANGIHSLHGPQFFKAFNTWELAEFVRGRNRTKLHAARPSILPCYLLMVPR
mmetsp:Transcript_17475/g.28283  ORF Transcript_17475/g.28283 Transcript_17475/m.28283 type:complete len:110 (+) Transcript_17475:1336-1665(+)